MPPKASIIIPVYNSEKYLGKCLDSALAQTYGNIEIIAVNDGSTDFSGKILRDYMKSNPDRVKAFDQENRGIGSTRNRGIEESSGEYLLFADNDDEMERDYVERFVELSEWEGCDMAIGGHVVCGEDGRTLSVERLPNRKWSAFRFVAPWARIYRRDFLKRHDLKFLDTRLGEDAAMNIPAALKSSKTSITGYCGYKWTKRRSSESNSEQKRISKWPEAEKTLRHIYEKSSPDDLYEEDRSLLEYFFIKFSTRFILHSGRHSGSRELVETVERMHAFLLELFPKYLQNSNLSPFRPDGESLVASTAVWTAMILRRTGLERAFLSLYGK